MKVIRLFGMEPALLSEALCRSTLQLGAITLMKPSIAPHHCLSPYRITKARERSLDNCLLECDLWDCKMSAYYALVSVEPETGALQAI
jgi:hypothetical protein